MEEITIEKALEFLCGVYFGRTYGDDPCKAASSRAYRDFNRTIRFKQKDNDKDNDKKRKELREETTILIREFIQKLKDNECLDQDTFDDEHKKLSESIISTYKHEVEEFTHGQAQKWVNMTLKYVYVLDKAEIQSIFQYCHVPIDNYILDCAKKEFGINKRKEAWSLWDNDTYREYQEDLRNAIKGKYPKECPLRWEFDAWMIASGN